MILGSNRACNGFIDTFRVTHGKWLESACIVVVLSDLSPVFFLYNGIRTAGARVYPGMFTFYSKCCLSKKARVDVSTRYPKNINSESDKLIICNLQK